MGVYHYLISKMPDMLDWDADSRVEVEGQSCEFFFPGIHTPELIRREENWRPCSGLLLSATELQLWLLNPPLD